MPNYFTWKEERAATLIDNLLRIFLIENQPDQGFAVRDSTGILLWPSSRRNAVDEYGEQWQFFAAV
jgi:hypothetical protein